MSSDWPEFSIDELKASSRNAIAMGPFGSRIKAENFVDVGVPVIKGGNLNGDFILEDKFSYLTDDKATELRTSNAFRRDIVITHRGTIGQVGIIPDNSLYERYVVSQSQLKVTLDQEKVNPYFIYYFLRSPLGQHRLLLNSSQVGVPAIAQASTSVKGIMVPCPDKDIQDKIVEILLNIDHKIELNRQTNQTLEQIAQVIFKSWFIDFDPVKAKIQAIEDGKDPEWAAMRAISGKPDAELEKLSQGQKEKLAETAALFPSEMVDSELGEIPLGWKPSNLGGHFNVVMGQSPKGESYNENGEGTLFFQGRRDFGDRYPEPRVYTTAPNRLANKDDTLISVRAPVGDRNMALENCCIGRGVAAIRHKTGSRSFTYAFISFIESRLSNSGSEGTVFNSINKNELSGVPFVAPIIDLINKFEIMIHPFDQKIEENTKETKILKELRDTLSPVLLSGKVLVKPNDN
tara:strand:- start:4527 stop:5909 length:1383 start_codon:yes stop_codon:yes gene_type:complete